MEILRDSLIVMVGLAVRMALVAVALVLLGIPAAILLFAAWVVMRMRPGGPGGEMIPVTTSPPQAPGTHGHRSRCWEMRNCPAGQREVCPAYRHHYLPCWMAVQLATGHLTRDCLGCRLFEPAKLAA